MSGQRSSYGKRSRSHSDYSDNDRDKRRNSGSDKDQFSIHPDDTVYRCLCPGKKIGSIIGRGGEIVKQLRIDTKSKIRIGESVPGCEERVITIYSTREETNDVEDSEDRVSPAQDALFKVHERIVAEDTTMDEDGEQAQVTVRLLVPSDQIGGLIGKGGQIVQGIRTETGAQIRIVKDRLPACALSSDELVQISGDPSVVKKALYQIASRLHDNPSRSQHLLSASSGPASYASGSSVPLMGLTPIVGAYGGYNESRSLYSAPRSETSVKEFSLCLVCPNGNIGGVIGKGGAVINQIRQDSRASIKVDSKAAADTNDCLISLSSKEIFEDNFSPTIDAAIRLQPRCSEKVERDSGLVSFTTRLLVPSSRIGCLIGKGGSIISEMRRVTKANIRVLSKDDLPKLASSDDELVLISGDPDVAKDALVQVASRLRANLFDREGAASAFLPVMPYVPMPPSESLRYDNEDAAGRGHGYGYSAGYGRDLSPRDSYGGHQTYGYGNLSSDRSAGPGLSGRTPGSRGRAYDY